MCFGLGVLRLAPRDFWAMTPREIHAAMNSLREHPARRFSREDLARLMHSFPDEVSA